MRSTRIVVGAAAFGACALWWAPSASAQEQQEAYVKQVVPAPSNSFELKFGAGYTQGFGNIAPGSSILSVAGAGIGVSADFDYRIDPALSFGLESQYQEFTTENNSGSRGLDLNLGVTYHVSPEQRGDPFLRLGTGYRMLWDVDHIGAPNSTSMYHGFDIVTLKLGYDIRTSSDVAFAPIIGADLQTFVWKDASALSTAQVGTFIYAGIQGRFDTATPSSSGVTVTSAPVENPPPPPSSSPY